MIQKKKNCALLLQMYSHPCLYSSPGADSAKPDLQAGELPAPGLQHPRHAGVLQAATQGCLSADNSDSLRDRSVYNWFKHGPIELHRQAAPSFIICVEIRNTVVSLVGFSRVTCTWQKNPLKIPVRRQYPQTNKEVLLRTVRVDRVTLIILCVI